MELHRVDSGHADEAVRLEQCITDATDEANSSEIFLGRGPLLQIAEVGMSRRVASIRKSPGGSWTLTALAPRPCYHRHENGSFEALKRGDQVQLESSDEIALWSHEKYVYKVSFGGPDVEPEKEKPNKVQKENVKPAESVQKERKLPDWLMKLPEKSTKNKSSDEESGAKKPKAAPTTTTKRPSPPKRAKVVKASPKPKFDLSFEGDDEASDTETAAKAAAVGGKHAISSDEDDRDSPRPEKKRAKMTSPLPKVSPKKVSPRKSPSAHAMSDDDEESAATASPKRLSTSSNKRSPKKEAGAHEMSDDEDDDEPNSSRSSRHSPKKVSPKKPSPGAHAISEDEDEDMEAGSSSSTKKRSPRKSPKEAASRDSEVKCEIKGADDSVSSDEESDDRSIRKPCMYGESCYRKNPMHRDEFSHPGDSDYETRKSEESDPNDERPECDYGVGCYRKNPQHRRDYKHTRKYPVRKETKKKKQAEQKKRKKTADLSGDESDSYESSFIDDDSEIEDISNDDFSEEEWVPTDDSD